MKGTEFSVAIFPFLKTSGPVRIGRHDFRCTTDLEGLPNDQAQAVTELASMLYLRDDVRIARAAYAIDEPLGSLRPGPVISHLERVRAVVGYFYSSPHPTFGDAFLPFENASLAIVSPSRVSIYLVRPEHGTISPAEPSAVERDDFGYVPGYEGVFNFRQPLWLTKSSRLYGPKTNMILNISQDLAAQLGHSEAILRADTYLLLNLLTAAASPFSERVFAALNWYNCANVDSEDADRSLLNLAIAFETLLQLPGHEKTDRLVDAISLLLGRTERLSEWATQFYAARSQVAHEGRVRDWRFYTQGLLKKNELAPSFGSIMTYGRQIFQLCLTTVLTGARLADEAGLKERFISNSERYAKIPATLSRFGGTPEARLVAIEPTVDGLSRYRFVGDGGLTIDGVLSAVRTAVKALLKCDVEFNDRLKSALESVATSPRKDEFASMTALSGLSETFKASDLSEIGRSAEIVALLVDIAWQDLFMTYYHMVERRKGETTTETKDS